MTHLTRLATFSALLVGGAAVAAAQGGNARMASMPGRAGRIARYCGSATDSTMRFRRAVGDSARTGVASMTAQPPAGTQPITGGTQRSHEYPEYDVVLDVPNLCVENIHLRSEERRVGKECRTRLAAEHDNNN